MKFQKNLGKTKFEIQITGFQMFAILAWSILLLLTPISIDQYSKTASNSSQEVVSLEKNRVAGAVTQPDSVFTYTVKIESQKELISTLTLVFGAISAAIAVLSLLYFIREHVKKEPSVFDS